MTKDLAEPRCPVPTCPGGATVLSRFRRSLLPLLSSEGRPSLAVFLPFLLAAFLISIGPRFQHYREWRENPTLHFADGIPVSTMDSYYWFRLAREYKQGVFEPSEKDPLRFYPEGRPYGRLPAISWTMAKLSRLLSEDVYQAGIQLTILLSSLFILPLGLFCFHLRCPAAALLGGLVGSFSPTYFYRTSITYVDTDGGNQFFLWLSAASIASISPSYRLRTNLVLSALSGLTVCAFCWWYAQLGFLLVYLGVFVVYLLALGMPRKQALVLLGTFLLFCNPLYLKGAPRSLTSFVSVYIFSTSTTLTTDHGYSDILPGFPNITDEIAELKRRSFEGTLRGVVRDPTLGIVGLCSFALLAATRWRVAIPMLPIIALAVLAFARAPRFIGYLAPLVGMGYGYALTVGLRGIVRLGSALHGAERASD